MQNVRILYTAILHTVYRIQLEDIESRWSTEPRLFLCCQIFMKFE